MMSILRASQQECCQGRIEEINEAQNDLLNIEVALKGTPYS